MECPVCLVIQGLDPAGCIDGHQGIGTGIEDGAGHVEPGPFHINGPGRVHGLFQGLVNGNILGVDMDPPQVLLVTEPAHGACPHENVCPAFLCHMDGLQGGSLIVDCIVFNLSLAQALKFCHGAVVHVADTQRNLLWRNLLPGLYKRLQDIKAGQLYFHHMLLWKQGDQPVICHAPGHQDLGISVA